MLQYQNQMLKDVNKVQVTNKLLIIHGMFMKQISLQIRFIQLKLLRSLIKALQLNLMKISQPLYLLVTLKKKTVRSLKKENLLNLKLLNSIKSLNVQQHLIQLFLELKRLPTLRLLLRKRLLLLLKQNQHLVMQMISYKLLKIKWTEKLQKLSQKLRNSKFSFPVKTGNHL